AGYPRVRRWSGGRQGTGAHRRARSRKPQGLRGGLGHPARADAPVSVQRPARPALMAYAWCARARATIGGKRSRTLSISAAVVLRPRLNRTASRARSGDRPRPSRTGEGWIEPEVQAAPVEAAMPARSRAITIDSPRAPANPALMVPPTRGAP